MELTLNSAVQMITVVTFILGGCNYAIVRPLQKSIDKLECSIEKLGSDLAMNNNRIIKVEESAKSAHKRIDGLEEVLHERTN